MLQLKVVQKPKTKLLFGNFFIEISAVYEIRVMWKTMVESDTPYMRIQYCACALHDGYLWPQTHTQNVYYSLLFHGNNSYANAPQCYVYRNIACLVNNVMTITFCASNNEVMQRIFSLSYS
jgi:hypothetical protein